VNTLKHELNISVIDYQGKSVNRPAALAAVFYILAAFIPVVTGQELTLPTYRMSIARDDLQRLLNDPYLATPQPAVITFEDVEYPAMVRFRGSSARRLPKHSWKLDFTAESPGEFSSLNLDAEYYDRSMSRDYFSGELGRIVGLPVPEMRHVSLVVNGVYHGVYLETEPIDRNFMIRRNLGEGALFAAINHMSRLTPMLSDSIFRAVYELQVRSPEAYDHLGRFSAFLRYGSEAEMEAELEDRIDAENFLKYFALQYLIGDWDGFCKNYRLFRPEGGLYILIPWDCDGALGNDWAGNFTNDHTRHYFDLLNSNVGFRRLIERQGGREQFLGYVETLRDEGFPRIDSMLDAHFDRLRHDAFLDTIKRATNQEFEQTPAQLRQYIRSRRESLADIQDWFNIRSEPVVTYSTHYAASPDEQLIVTAELPRRVSGINLDLVQANDNHVHAGMRDDGNGPDRVAWDTVYSAQIDLNGLVFPLYPTVWLYSQNGEGFPFPRYGSYLQSFYPLAGPMIRLDDEPPESADVALPGWQEIIETSTTLIPVVNRRESAIDLSGCRLSLDRGYRTFMLPSLTPLETDDTLFVTNHFALAKAAYPNRLIVGGFYFIPERGDTLTFSNLNGDLIARTVVGEQVRAADVASGVVINEVNYNSGEQFDPGDWIELTALGAERNLSGWTLRDGGTNNSFTFPEGTLLRPGEYLVVAEHPDQFSGRFGNVERLTGGFYFSFDNDADDVRLYDNARRLVDWVSYEDGGLWPEEADGEGSTLMLTSPELSNYGPYHWEASAFPFRFGTPGRPNPGAGSVKDEGSPPVPGRWQIEAIYPNPFNGVVKFVLTGRSGSPFRLRLTDVSGRTVTALLGRFNPAGRSTIDWIPTSGVPTGIYLASLEGGGVSSMKKLLLLK
jgi:hypothetical protein